MIKRGTKLTLKPNMYYGPDDERNEDVGINKNDFGEYQQLQAMDVNDCGNGKIRTGFFYVRIYTDLPLAVGDTVTVKEIIYAQRKRNVCVLGMTIEETPIMSVAGIENDVGF